MPYAISKGLALALATAPLFVACGGGNADTVCKKIQNCPDLYPPVVCLIPGNQHAGHDNVANPGFGTFLTMFEKAPFLTP